MFFSAITNNLNQDILTKNLVTFKRRAGDKDENFLYYGVALIGCVMTNESNDTESDIDLGQSDYDREKVQIHTYLLMNQKILQMNLIYIKKLRHCCY